MGDAEGWAIEVGNTDEDGNTSSAEVIGAAMKIPVPAAEEEEAAEEVEAEAEA